MGRRRTILTTFQGSPRALTRWANGVLAKVSQPPRPDESVDAPSISSKTPYHVSLWSASRDQIEQLDVMFHDDNRTASVGSQSGALYTTTDQSCTCPDWRYRHGRLSDYQCRHMQAFNKARGYQIQEATHPELVSRGTYRKLGPKELLDVYEAVGRVTDEEHGQWVSVLKQTATPSSLPIATMSDSEWLGLVREVLASPPPFETSRVLTGAPITFGVELECLVPPSKQDALFRDLHAQGLLDDPAIKQYGTPSSQLNRWHAERDMSLSDADDPDGLKSVELVSPILTDHPETWENLRTLCQTVIRHGGSVDYKCGTHIHVGADTFDHDTSAVTSLVNETSRYEDVLFRLAAQEGGHLRGTKFTQPYPLAQKQEILDHAPTKDFWSTLRLLQWGRPYDPGTPIERDDYHQNRYYGLNLTNMGFHEQKNTVEFRYWNGTLNPNTVQNHVRVVNGMVQLALRTREQDRSDLPRFPFGGHASHDTPSPDTHATIRQFVTDVGGTIEDQLVLIWSLYKTQWQMASSD